MCIRDSLLNYALIRDVGATTASTVTYLIPIVAVALGVMVLGDRLAWHHLVGGRGLRRRGRRRSAAPADRRAVGSCPQTAGARTTGLRGWLAGHRPPNLTG